MAKQSRSMVLNRNLTLDTIYGQSIRFVKNEPTHVPSICVAAALAIGAEFVDGSGVEVEEPEAVGEPMDPAERAMRTLAAVTQLADKNNNADFTAAGMPKVDSVGHVLGYKASAKEIATAWQAYHDAKAADAG